jgi:hypothetical protein
LIICGHSSSSEVHHEKKGNTIKRKRKEEKEEVEIPRWQLEGGSRKRASQSKILERRWRNTLQEKPPRRGKTPTPPHPPAHA